MEADMAQAGEKLKMAKTEFEKVQLEYESFQAKAVKVEQALQAAKDEAKAATRGANEYRRQLEESERARAVAEEQCQSYEEQMGSMKSSLERSVQAAIEEGERKLSSVKADGEQKLSSALSQARKITSQLDEKESLANRHLKGKNEVSDQLQDVQTRAAQEMGQLQNMIVEARVQIDAREKAERDLKAEAQKQAAEAQAREDALTREVDALKADIDKARGMADKYHSDGLSASELLQSLETQFRADKAALQVKIDDAKAARARDAALASEAQGGLQRNIAVLEGKIREKNAQLADQEKKLKDLVGDMSQSSASASELQRRLTAMVALREAAEEKIKEAQSEVDYMKGEVAEAAQAVEAKDAELSDKIAETQVALRDAANSKTLHKKTEQGLSALKEECSATSAKLLGQARDHKEELDNMSTLHESEKDEIHKQMQATAEELLQLNDKYQTARAGMQTHERRAGELTFNLKSAHDELKDVKADLDDVQGELVGTREDLAECMDALASCQKQLAALTKSAAMLEEIKNQAVQRVAELELDVETREKRADFAEVEMERLQEDLVKSLQANRVYSKKQEELGGEVLVKRMETQEANLQLDEAVGIVAKLHEKLKEERENANGLLAEHERLKQLQDRTRGELEKALNETEVLENLNEVTMGRYEGALLECDRTQGELASSQLEVTQAQKVLRLAQDEFEALRNQRNYAEDKYLSLKDEGERHMREIMGAGEIMLTRYESGDFLSEADKLAKETAAALAEANSIASSRSKRQEDFPEQRARAYRTLMSERNLAPQEAFMYDTARQPAAPKALAYHSVTSTFVPTRNVALWPR